MLTSNNIIPKPMSNEEIMRRAIQRAYQAYKTKQADYAVGFSEGVIETEWGLYTAVWCAVVTGKGEIHLGGGCNSKLDNSLIDKLHKATLEESDIERFIIRFFPQTYDLLVEQALISEEENYKKSKFH